MSQSRRDFMKSSAIVAGSALFAGKSSEALANTYLTGTKSGRLKLSFKPYTLERRHVFTIANS